MPRQVGSDYECGTLTERAATAAVEDCLTAMHDGFTMLFADRSPECCQTSIEINVVTARANESVLPTTSLSARMGTPAPGDLAVEGACADVDTDALLAGLTSP